MTTPPDDIRRQLLRFAPMIYGPTVVFALGEGAVLPLIPVIAARLGADLAIAALVAAALVVGQVCGNVPSGWAVARIGERYTMALAGLAALGGAIAFAFATDLVVLTISIFVIGFCAAAFGLARHAFMTTRVPLAFRARALSLLGGSFRLGMFVGPFISAALLAITGTEASSVWFFALCLAVVVALVTFGPDPETAVSLPSPCVDETSFEDTGEPISTGPVPVVPAARAGVFRTMWNNRTLLSRLGLAAASLASVRSARQAVLPLWGVSIGLDAPSIALVVGISGAIDFALFYVSGQIMDRFGRLWAALPAMILMGLGFLVLAFTHDVPQATMWYAAFAVVLGVGNGLSSGILLTLGADVAPPHEPAAFLGSWRTLTDAGGAVTPLLVSGVTALASLSWATGVMGVIGLLGAAAFARWVPLFVPRR